jgi:hypothetical protein
MRFKLCLIVFGFISTATMAQSQTNFNCVVSDGGAYYGPFSNEAQAVEQITNQMIYQGMPRGSFTVTCYNMGAYYPPPQDQPGFVGFGAVDTIKNSNQQISK